MNWTTNAERLRPAMIAAAVLFFCLASITALGQRGQEARPAPPPRARMAQRQFARQQNQQRRFQKQQRQYQNQQRPFQNQQRPYQQPPLSNGGRLGPQGQEPAGVRPAYPNASRPEYTNPGASRPGHLGAWLNQHQGLQVQEQERLLRNDPSFEHLPPATQQRYVQQLHELDQMPEAERERRLARSEMLERLSPQQQMQVRQAGRQLAALPPDRQMIVGRAFQDLSHVPLDQRDTVLNSARYQGTFSPDERVILSNLLRAQPYEPAR